MSYCLSCKCYVPKDDSLKKIHMQSEFHMRNVEIEIQERMCTTDKVKKLIKDEREKFIEKDRAIIDSAVNASIDEWQVEIQRSYRESLSKNEEEVDPDWEYELIYDTD